MLHSKICCLAICLLSIRVTAVPQPQATDPAFPPGPIVNVTAQTPINGSVSIMTSLIIGDDSGCDPDQKIAIKQAYIDALNILGTVGGYNGPGGLYASALVPPWDYFGPGSRTTHDLRNQIMYNFIHAQAPNKQWGTGDWWYDRYYDVYCNDPGDKTGHDCLGQGNSPGYEVEPSYRNDGGKYPLINFCASFWDMESLADRVAQVEEGGFGFDKNDVRSLVSQGSAFLHEMFHTSATASGVSSPRCQDVKVSGYPGKAYGPSRAKMLARMDLGGPLVTSTNVDNYVFYAISWYMYSKWKIIPKLPPPSWPILSSAEGPDDNSAEDADDDDSIIIASGPILDDADFYAGSGYTPVGGNQPAGPTGPSTETEYIPGSAPMTSTVAAATPASSTPPAAPPVAPPAYAPGTCSFHLTETETCDTDDKNLFATITLLDNNKANIGGVPSTSANPYGVAINDANKFLFLSSLPLPIAITAEHEGDYIQFTYGGTSWTSQTAGPAAGCSNGGWDPRDGPTCGGQWGSEDNVATNQMDCSFSC